MHNPLLVGLVAYALRTSQSVHQSHFQPHFLELVKDLRMSENWDELPWYADLHQDWVDRIETEAFLELLSDFKAMFGEILPEQLIPPGQEIRLRILVDNAKPISYKITSVYGTFTVQWEDGTQIEYNCRPLGAEKVVFNTQMIAKLSHLFADQFVEASVQPGLDTFHDQVAKPFDPEKFSDLMKILQDHIQGLDAADREDYMHIFIRLNHQFGPGPDMQMQGEDPPLEFIEGGGGF